MKDDPSLTYNEAFNRTAKDPSMAEVFREMRQPVMSEILAPPLRPSVKAAGAKFAGLVREAAVTRQLTWDKAWSAIAHEEPELYAAMGGGGPEKGLSISADQSAR